MKVVSKLLAALIVFPSIALADAPVIESAAFTADGKLKVRVSDVGTPECYVTVLGGLSRTDVETSIKGIRVNAAQAEAGKANIKTTRRYYCSQRSLFVKVDRICLDDYEPGTSEVVRVIVPRSNRN